MPLPGTLATLNVVTPNTDYLLYTADAPCIVNINLCNRNSTTVALRIAIATGTLDDSHYIECDKPLEGKQAMERTGKALSAGDKVYVRSNTANVSARIEGVAST